jgi:hypothetical protein
MAIFFASTPRYLDRSDQEQWAIIDRLLTQHEDACHEAGGNWVAGFADAHCSVSYPPPDTSWYVRPTENPLYLPFDFLSIIFIVVALVGIMGTLLLAMETIGGISVRLWEQHGSLKLPSIFSQRGKFRNN